jgi:hypothetical protein
MPGSVQAQPGRLRSKGHRSTERDAERDRMQNGAP